MRKENQGLTEAGEFGRVPEGASRDACQFDRVPDFFVVRFPFFVVPGRGVLHTPHKRPDRGDLIYL